MPPLSTDDVDPAPLLAPQDEGDIAAWTILVRFDHMEDTASRHCRIEGIAAPFQHGHAGGTGLPVGGGHHAEGSDKFRA